MKKKKIEKYHAIKIQILNILVSGKIQVMSY